MRRAHIFTSRMDQHGCQVRNQSGSGGRRRKLFSLITKKKKKTHFLSRDLWPTSKMLYLWLYWIEMKQEDPSCTEISVDWIACSQTVDQISYKIIKRIDQTVCWSKIVRLLSTTTLTPLVKPHIFGLSTWWYNNTLTENTFDTFK